MDSCGTNLILTNLLLAGLVLVPVLALPLSALVQRFLGRRRQDVEMVLIPGIGTVPVLREEPRRA